MRTLLLPALLGATLVHGPALPLASQELRSGEVRFNANTAAVP